MNKEQVKKVLGEIKLWMDRILAVACAILLSFMTFLVLWQVFTRYVLNNPAAFTEELVKDSLIWTGFIGAAYAFSTREHMSLTIIRDKLTGTPHKILMVAIDALILVLAVMVITIGGFKLAISAKMEYPRSLVYSCAPVSGIFIILAQLINLFEDITGEKVDAGEAKDEAKGGNQ